MILLALESSTERRSVAVARNGTLLAESSHTGGRETPLARLVTETLARAGARTEDVDTLAVGLGPGSYTGIRATIAFAQGWVLARPSVRLRGLGSVDACARRAWHHGLRGTCTLAVDAQRGEAYLAVYELTPAGVTCLTPLRLAARPDLDPLRSEGSRLVGPDLAALGLRGTPVWPDAAALAELATDEVSPDGVAPERLEPIYLRATAFVKAPPPRYPAG